MYTLRRMCKRFYLKIKYRKFCIKLGCNSNIGINSKFGGMNVIGCDTTFSGDMGYGSYVGEGAYLAGVKIGKFCSIAKDVCCVTGVHPTGTFVSTSPCFFSLRKQNGETFVSEQKFQEEKYAGEGYYSIIGNDVWIGQGARIMSGVAVGDGAIIAAGAVVTKDVMPYSIVGGIPAKEIKKRFSDEEIKFLCEFKWWDKPVEWIEKHACLFDDINKFMEVCHE